MVKNDIICKDITIIYIIVTPYFAAKILVFWTNQIAGRTFTKFYGRLGKMQFVCMAGYISEREESGNSWMPENILFFMYTSRKVLATKWSSCGGHCTPSS